ncbi:hypothetical protein [Sinorhizobium meliloti]|uniref:hypothetical protein n=1 Tax=Rhizobium meliloti TaxID=382 RepID=UPI000FDA0AB5|nr:hypothetical protein [Sinorhizobium meliloti]RVE83727.1 hypothetical protein CN238_26035 [Sinorhizobium meliloti]RVH24536.1 hypothetical protein CN214_25290 [Sinorhizobium meliloti]
MDDSTALCGDNDSIAIYTDKSVRYWEAFCEITRKTPLTSMKGIILDLSCSAEGEKETRRELLLDNGGGGIVSYPPLVTRRTCDSPAPPVASACDFNKRVYRSDPRAGTNYQELRFLDGLASGAAKLTQFTDGKPQWVANGEFGCSNGASICAVSFKTMSGEEVNLPYELVRTGVDDEHTVVIPSLAQSVYYASLNADGDREPYRGLVADLLGGYVPDKTDMITPENIYNFSHCEAK